MTKEQVKAMFSGNWKRYALSSAVTFLSGFAIYLLANMDNLTLDTFEGGAIFSILFLAVRAGFKVVLESFITTSISEVRTETEKVTTTLTTETETTTPAPVSPTEPKM